MRPWHHAHNTLSCSQNQMRGPRVMNLLPSSSSPPSPWKHTCSNRSGRPITPLTLVWWKDKYNDILERGYQLRLRYQPRWELSWKKSTDMLSVVDRRATTASKYHCIPCKAPHLGANIATDKLIHGLWTSDAS